MSEQTYRCDVCGAGFETDEQLRDHWEETHETREPINATSRTS